MALTLQDAKELQYRQELYYSGSSDYRGAPQKWRVSGKPKTWKTRPNEVEVPIKWGMYVSAKITENDLNLFHFYEWEAVKGAKIEFKKTDKSEYTLHFNGKMFGVVFKDGDFWYSSRLDRDKPFRTRMGCARNVLNCLY